MIESLNRVEISLSALRHNFSLLQAKAPDAAVLAMVKADGYGHGMVECARTLAAAGADCFGVAEAVEGVELRKNGIDHPVFIMAGLLPEIIPALFEYRLTPVVVDGSCLEILSCEAVQREQEIGLHLKVDAGMGRQGCALSSIGGILQQIQKLPGLSLDGIMAHFPMADDPDSDSTAEITAAFGRQLEKVQELLSENILLHLANSGGILYFPGSRQDMIRPGISLYGYYPDGAQGKKNAEEPQLQPVMRFTSRIIQVKEVPVGTGLGYGHTFTTNRMTRIAIIPAGYEDGYLRSLSNKAEALIHGQRVPAVGRISMNLTMFDVTDLEQVEPGDEVVLLGRQGDEEITADEIATWMDTISYEVLCLFGNLNNRVYVKAV
ncbi:MAG: alanine racemase [Thermodesulfobacteriota bacterium]|nr:alanine racemase [Thermodesulfobacteriota bacterium]